MKILVIDDDENYGGTLKEVLEESGYEVGQEITGKEGVKKVKEDKKIGLVILDLQLPDMTGFQICQIIQKSRKELPIIIMTGRFMELSEKLQGLELGAIEYLIKPVDINELLAKINMLLTVRK